MPGVPRSLSLHALRRRGEGAAIPAVSLDPTAPAIIVCTSGTTGAPNAVVHSRGSVAAIIAAVGTPLGFEAHDIVYARELHTALPALLAGATVVVSRHSSFVPRRVVAAMERHGVTCWFGVTSDCNALVEYLAAQGTQLPSTLRQLAISSAPVRAPFLRRLRDVLAPGTRVWCVYGLTEMVPVAYVDVDEKLAYEGEGDLVGRPLPGISARLARDGELLLRGPNLCSGYLGHPPLRELATGDLARIDEGRLVLLGRRKDMMIRGSHNIYPELYEPAIERIAGVRRCALVGVYDERAADERIVLNVEAEPGVDDRALKARVCNALRRGPSRIDDAAYPDLILVAPLPVCGRSSKVDRERLRALARGRLPCASR
jgi:acyl-CoA synthetase (AMP-forming)/AMP-acid ligase II